MNRMHDKIPEALRRAANIGVAIAALAVTWLGSRPVSGQQPAFGNVAVEPVMVEAVPFQDTPPRLDQAEVLQRLSQEATARAERTLLRQGLASKVERTAAQAPSGTLILTGTVRLPVSVPAGQRGARAMFRKGPFGTATVSLRRSDGTLVAEGQSKLDWDDVRWLRGVRVRRVRDFDEVLQDAVRKATDHAIKGLRSKRSPGVSD